MHRKFAAEVERASQRIAEIEASSGDLEVRYSRRARRDKSRARWEKNRARRDAQRAKAEALALASADLAGAQARLEEFEEKARRLGVPPGWIRR